MYWAVPVFFMITGALMLDPDKKISVSSLFIYVRRIMCALILFGLPYAMLKLIPQYGVSPIILIKAVGAVISDTGFGHLWYLYVLMGIYLVLPVFKSFIEKAGKEELVLVIFALGTINFLFPLISNLTKLKIAFSVPFSYPVFYLLLGYILNKNRAQIKEKRLVLLAMLLMLIAFVWFVNFKNLNATIWTAYTSPLIAILAAVIFSLFVLNDFKERKRLWGIDRLCFGAYLIHPLFIQFSYRFLKITPLNFEMYFIGALSLFVVFTILAFVASWILMRFSLLKKYVL